MKSFNHKYRIVFPGGELIYHPVEGIIIDPVRKRTVSLPEKRKFSLLTDRLQGRDFSFSDFKPSCLTIYMGHQCNMDCLYCYVPHKDEFPDKFIDMATIRAGALWVAESCREQNLPFVIGFHGGNEPLLHPDKIDACLKICELTAKKMNVEFLSFCTTNGNISENTAKWAAQAFYGITLSWDGPPGFQDVLRKDKYGNISSRNVERSAAIFSGRRPGTGNLAVRCTITSLSVDHMEEITGYFEKFGMKTVEFYPVFQNKDESLPKALMPDPEKYVYHFLKARSSGLSKGMHILYSGSRITDLHNRYCMLLQDNLTLTPDGFLTNCFYRTWNFEEKLNCFFYGKYHPESDRMEFDVKILHQIMKTYDSDMADCLDCFNQFHCSHKCPDLCPFQDQPEILEQSGCIREKWLGLASVLEYAGYLPEFNSEMEFSDFFQNSSYCRIQ